MENLELSLLLLLVGMSTVFVILLIIIYLGKGLIGFVNKFVPEEQSSRRIETENGNSDKIEKIIALAVSTVTNGKGIVTTIEKR